MTSFFRTFFGESSIHGFPYISMRSLHLLERIFWLAVMGFASLFSFSICWDQWIRFKTNPIAYVVEKDSPNQMLPYIGVTMCSNYFDEDDQKRTIQKLWGIGERDELFGYYMEFLKTITRLTFDNMDILTPYASNQMLNNAPLLNLTLEIRKKLPFLGRDKIINLSNNNEELALEAVRSENVVYATVMTEVGLCFSTTYLNEYQNPYGRYRMNVSKSSNCRPMEPCLLKINPFIGDGSHLLLYFHSNDDLVTGNDRGIVKRDLTGDGTIEMTFAITSNSAERQVRQLPIAYRKCRFPDENNLKYFRVYRPRLCCIESRIDAALQMCNCKPFFYVIGTGQTCDINGLLCLVNGNWSKTNCAARCYPLCEEVEYTEQRDIHVSYDGGVSKFERMAFVSMQLSPVAVKRRVIFSYDQLLVAFGGAASFFLGCNFLSFVELLFFVLEYVCATLANRNRSNVLKSN